MDNKGVPPIEPGSAEAELSFLAAIAVFRQHIDLFNEEQKAAISSLEELHILRLFTSADPSIWTPEQIECMNSLSDGISGMTKQLSEALRIKSEAKSFIRGEKEG